MNGYGASMAKWTWTDDGIANMISAFDKFSDRDMEEIAGSAIYVMANEVANQVKANISALPTSSDKEYKGNSKYLIPDKQKQGLLSSFGISKMKAVGSREWNVKLGFDGYNDVVTKTYPQGQPNALIARLTESGSTYRIKQPFFRSALNASKGGAKERGEEEIKKQFDKYFK